MRNLKKVLALVLAMAMSLSLAVTASASYNTFDDQAEIVNDEAVFLLNALGIVEGRETGDFDPAANINRAEASKLVAALNLAGVPVPNAKGVSSFSDVLGDGSVAWANNFIEYGVSQGSINGMGDGTFAPKANVTGVQFAKMLLGILGYDAAEEGYTGTNWMYNVNIDAVDAGLYRGLDIDATAALSRDDAAQMMYNALKAYTVIYLTDTTGALEITKTNLMEDKYPTVYGGEGIMTAIEYDVDDAEYTYTVGGKDFVTEVDYTDMLGMNVMYVIDRVEGVLGFYAYDNGAVVTGLWGDFDKAQLIKDELYVEGATKEVRFQPANHAVDLTTAAAPSANTCDYSEYKAIDNDNDGDFDYVIVYRVFFETVKHVSSTRVLSNDGTTYDFEDHTIYAGVAKDDAIAVTYDTSLKTACVLEEVAAQTGVINTVRADDGQVYEIVIGGATYDWCNVGTHTQNVPALINNWPGKTVEFYVINGYVVDMTVDYSLSRDYLLITAIDGDYNADGYSVDATVLFSDGTTDVITIASLTDWDNTELKGTNLRDRVLTYLEQNPAHDSHVGYLARFEVLADGKYELTSTSRLDDMVAAGVADLGFTGTAAWYNTTAPAYHPATTNTENGYITVGSTVVRIADDALVFLVDFDGTEYNYSAVSGADIVHMTGWDSNAVVNYVGYEEGADGWNYATLIFMQADPEFMSDDITGIVTSDPMYETNEDDSFVYFELYDGAETYTVYTKYESGLARIAKGDIITFRVDGGKMQMVTPVKGDDYAITAYSPDSSFAEIALSDSGAKADEVALKIAKDCQTIFFDFDKYAPATGEIEISDNVLGTYYENVFAVVNRAGEITLLIVDPVVEGSIAINPVNK